MDYVVPFLALIGLVVAFVPLYLNTPKRPKYDALGDLVGKKFFGFVRVDWDSQPVHFIVGKEQLGIIGGFPSFSLLLDINDLELSIKREFIGYKVIIISNDFYTEHLFKQLIVSARVAKKLQKLTNGKLALRDV
ncbi:hypothetical protein [Agarivorans albus]|uniref:hypothetical protein n=1 Tax=Agarivorans albus TaxID=182262 RepID=UPI00058B2F91|nr:hypothetical protein [Agarivorans albus]